jgi:N-acetylglucosaminyl-diphospho-decaprenol L-rhamnosyltransferase
MSKLAIITINHNHCEMLKKMVESLDASMNDEPFVLPVPARVFVVNNIPDPAAKVWLAEAAPAIQVIENPRPQGFAYNINQVIRRYPGFEFYLLINPDVICLPGMIEKLIAVMEGDANIGVAGPELLNFDGTIQPSRRRFASFRVLIFRALHLDSIFKNLPAVDHYLMTNDSFEQNAEVDWITGAVMLLRGKALDQVGLMDERFFLYFEDEDLCCRMWQHGWKVCYTRSARAYHAHIAEGRKKILSKANFHHLLSACKMLIKYRGRISACTQQGRKGQQNLLGEE